MCIVSKVHVRLLHIWRKKGAILQRPLPWELHNLTFLRQAEICRQGPKEQFDTCRSFLHDGRIRVPKIHPWPLPYYMYYNKQNMVSEVTIDNEHIKLY